MTAASVGAEHLVADPSPPWRSARDLRRGRLRAHRSAALGAGIPALVMLRAAAVATDVDAYAARSFAAVGVRDALITDRHGRSRVRPRIHAGARVVHGLTEPQASRARRERRSRAAARLRVRVFAGPRGRGDRKRRVCVFASPRGRRDRSRGARRFARTRCRRRIRAACEHERDREQGESSHRARVCAIQAAQSATSAKALHSSKLLREGGRCPRDRIDCCLFGWVVPTRRRAQCYLGGSVRE